MDAGAGPVVGQSTPMAKQKNSKPVRREIRPSSWALIAMGAVTLLLLYAGATSGNWRGVIVTEVQVLAVGWAAWFGLRS